MTARRSATFGGAKILRFRLLAALALLPVAGICGEEKLLTPAHRLAPEALEWRDLAKQFQTHGDVTAEFEEQRFFPFRAQPVILKGEVRVSAQHGLSLHYTSPEERTVILDAYGLITREPTGQNTPPMDPRAAVANEALLRVLRFDFASLAQSFEIYGERKGADWMLGLVPRATDVRRALGAMYVSGESDTVRRIEFRRDAKQHIDIVISAPQATHAFTPDEVGRFFR